MSSHGAVSQFIETIFSILLCVSAPLRENLLPKRT
jgi:hypothetical protein